MKLWAEQALLPQGWQRDVAITIGDDGVIENVVPGAVREGEAIGALLPAPVNLHSHAFQRAMAGLSERRGAQTHDTFWTWRQIMFRFLEHLSPDDMEAIAAFVQMEMLEAGFCAVAEFHYVHHKPDGTPYDDIAELASRIVAAADQTGIGLTLLPVLYEHGGCDGRPLGAGQVRFGNDMTQFARLWEESRTALKILPDDARIGVAPHSLRAVSREALAEVVQLAAGGPLHMHLAEQTGEVDEVKAAWGRRPVEWLLENHDIDQRWCLIHCTQMQPHETKALAQSGAVVGLCPITESSLGDGIFDGVAFAGHGGRLGIGSDSNIRIALSEELRTLEYSQRLRDRRRALLATAERSTGRVLLDNVVAGGAQAAGRNSGAIEAGRLADLFAFDTNAIDLAGKTGDGLLDAYIFAGDDRMVSDVWAAGRHMVQGGRHVERDAITARYRQCVKALLGKL